MNQQLETGQIVKVRSRQYLVEEVASAKHQNLDTLVTLSCLEDDALGEKIEVLWEREIDAEYIGKNNWETIACKGFDKAKLFSAYFHALQWNCVTSTESKIFQAPYRAGIEVKTYQLEPLKKALNMPRVSLFIADDVGLGKTIEAGLILREMLMRQKVKRVVISAPPSVVQQWHEEMENRFGLTFIILDRKFFAEMRLQRGYGINPWTTHTRFIISHALLRDESYAAPLRDWLGEFSAGSMLILDEAHHGAPATSSQYATDSQFTRTLRDIAPKFEHKLFLSATPHNGHSNSFAALLEILDPQRFCRGVPVRSGSPLLDAVMVRRLKRDLRDIGISDFPRREVVPVAIDNLPADAPELLLSELLQEYRELREERLKGQSRSRQKMALLVVINLQKRLLSSIEAFARTLKVHRMAVEKEASKQKERESSLPNLNLLGESPGGDDDRAELPEADVEAEENAVMSAATRQTGIGVTRRELELLEAMTDIASAARYRPDPRCQYLTDWLREHLCPNLGEPGAAWSDRRVLIFTEYTDTKRYLVQQLAEAIAHSDQAEERIGVFHGGMGEEKRQEIQNAFNAHPQKHPLRILVATDAAREGVNLQNYCSHLFHFDIPWNPSPMEQRNGRIDRKLQREKVVYCYYFLLPQRTEDQVLDVLLKKTATIHRELGSLTPVIEKKVGSLLEGGIIKGNLAKLKTSAESLDGEEAEGNDKQRVIREELELPEANKALAKQISELEQMLAASQEWLNLNQDHFREALSASLELLGGEALQPEDAAAAVEDSARARWLLPALDGRAAADPTWAVTLDSLRTPRQRGQKPWEWRREAAIRPVVFREPGSLDGEVVHLHLEHRLVQPLLGRFLAQGFLHDEMSRACVCLTDDPVPKVIALGRLSLYGEGASRLHDEIVAVAAEWESLITPGSKKLKPLGEGKKDEVLRLLEVSLGESRWREVPERVKAQLQEASSRDVGELVPHLEKRAEVLAERAEKKLTARGKKEGEEMKRVLEQQRRDILERREETGAVQLKLDLFNKEEREQIDSDRRYWVLRLERLEGEVETEPARIEASYQVKTRRIEPVGLVYLWPVSK